MSKPKALDPTTRRSIEMYLDRIEKRFPIAEVWLYGSRARGDAKPDSDADLAIILNGPKQRAMTVALAMNDPAYDIMLETGLNISAYPIWQEDWKHPENHSNPWLIANIKREGVSL